MRFLGADAACAYPAITAFFDLTWVAAPSSQLPVRFVRVWGFGSNTERK